MNFSLIKNLSVPNGWTASPVDVATWCGYYDLRASREAVILANQQALLWVAYGFVAGGFFMFFVCSWYFNKRRFRK